MRKKEHAVVLSARSNDADGFAQCNSVTVPRTPHQLHPAKTPSSLPTIPYCFAKCAEPRRVHQHAPTPRHGPGFVLIRPHYEFIMNLFVVQTLYWIHAIRKFREISQSRRRGPLLSYSRQTLMIIALCWCPNFMSIYHGVNVRLA